MNINIAAERVEEQRGLINAIRDAKEIAPISVTFSKGTYVVDCDEKADSRFQNAIAVWDSLSIPSIQWVLADNSTLVLFIAELIELYAAMGEARAIRSMALQQYAKDVKDLLPLKEDHPLFDGDNWPG